MINKLEGLFVVDESCKRLFYNYFVQLRFLYYADIQPHLLIHNPGFNKGHNLCTVVTINLQRMTVYIQM